MSVKNQVTFIDAHVHIHDCFDLSVFFDSAYNNFKKIALQLKAENAFVGVLLLSETSKDHWFQYLKNLVKNNQISITSAIAGDWHFECSGETCSIRAYRSNNKELIIVAGRQIVTSEKLEILALGTEEYFPDGAPIGEVIEAVRISNGIAVLPWGFGKWIGRRGSIVMNLLEMSKTPNFFLGDNSGRLRFFLHPRYFRLARMKGIRILPGSDPLPFPSEVWRPGSFGFMLRHTIGNDTPAADIKRILTDGETIILPYGKLENPYRFLKNQLAMQYKKFKYH